MGFECPTHNIGFLEFKYLLGSPLGDFWSVLSKSSSAPFLFLLGCFFYIGAFGATNPYSAFILKVNVNFNC